MKTKKLVWYLSNAVTLDFICHEQQKKYYVKVYGHRCWRTSHTFGYIKNQITTQDKMSFVTYNNIRLKCYINVSKCLLDILYIAPHEVAGSPILARAIDHFYSFLNKIKKINYNFSTVIIPVSSLSIHLILSPAVNSNFSTISRGIPHLNELYWGFA